MIEFRKNWIDSLKGAGILCVVVGHIFVGPAKDVVYLWHMPLFFLHSGYLYRPEPNLHRYFTEKSKHLLVPYLAFFLVISLRDIKAAVVAGDMAALVELPKSAILGGRQLKGWYGAFWFITVLFLTQQIANYIFPRFSKKVLSAMMVASTAGAYLTAPMTQSLAVPWSADTVLFTLPLFFLGWQYRIARLDYSRKFDVVSSFISIAGLVAVSCHYLHPFDLKYLDYGTPFGTLAVALFVIHSIVRLAQRLPDHAPMAIALGKVGQASMVIMFTHLAINIYLKDRLHVESPFVRFLVSIAVPWLMYLVIERTAIGRAVFLGYWHSRRSTTASAALANPYT